MGIAEGQMKEGLVVEPECTEEKLRLGGMVEDARVLVNGGTLGQAAHGPLQ